MDEKRSRLWSNIILLVGVGFVALSFFMASTVEEVELLNTLRLRLPSHVEPIRVPRSNPMTAEKAELGRHLFYDQRLSFNEAVSCSSCHQQDKAFTDGRSRSIGATGEETRRNSPTLSNVGFNDALTWASSVVVTLEQQALLPLLGEHPIEMGVRGHEEVVLARIGQEEIYQRLFAAAFPQEESPVSLENIIKALATFQRTMTSYNAPWDRFVSGDKTAISESAKQGLALFFDPRLNCFRCHGGHHFRITEGHRVSEDDTSVAFHNIGMYNVDGEGSYPVQDQGLFEVTGNPDDRGKFKSPTLRNIAVTGPYMHDGSIATLEEVIDFYARGGLLTEEGPNAGDGKISPLKSELIKEFELSDPQRDDLLEFLHTLTDRSFIYRDALENPWN